MISGIPFCTEGIARPGSDQLFFSGTKTSAREPNMVPKSKSDRLLIIRHALELDHMAFFSRAIE
jgi:hypothetical protein